MSDIKKRIADGLTTVSAAQGCAMASLKYRDYDRAVETMELAIDMVKNLKKCLLLEIEKEKITEV